MVGRIWSEVDKNELANLAYKMVEILSPTGEEHEIGRFYAEVIRGIGLKVNIEYIDDDRPLVLARLKGEGGGRSLLFIGHLDTIPIGNCVTPKLDDFAVWGRGSEDMKGGLAAIAQMLRTLRENRVRLKGDIYLAAIPDHEAPAGKSRGVLRIAEMIRSREINVDGGIAAEGPNKIWISSLGLAVFTIRIKSLDASKHTSQIPFERNPLLWTARLVNEFSKLSDELDRGIPHPLCGTEKMNLGIVRGGDFFNRIPVECEVTGTRRWVPGKRFSAVDLEFKDILNRFGRASGHEFSIEYSLVREPYEIPIGDPIVQSVTRAVKRITKRKGEVIGLGLADDASLITNEGGIPCLSYGPRYITAHSDNEHLPIQDLLSQCQVFLEVATGFCGVVD